MIRKRNEKLNVVVGVTNQAFQSQLGMLYIGQTRAMYFGNNLDAWAGIVNPKTSGVNLYINQYIITNISNEKIQVNTWFNAKIPENAALSSSVTPANQKKVLGCKEKGQIQFADQISEPMTGEVNVLGRIIQPNESFFTDTLDGAIILGPGKSFSMSLHCLCKKSIIAIIVFTWWEEEI